MRIFNAFIFSNLIYCSAIWHFCSMQDTKKIEKIQHRSLCYIFSDFHASYDDLRKKANIELLYTQRMKRLVTEIFKIMHGLTPKYFNHLTTTYEAPYKSRRGNQLKCKQFKSFNYGKNSFTYMKQQDYGIASPIILKNVIRSRCIPAAIDLELSTYIAVRYD